MLKHAFDNLRMIRVQLSTAASNLRAGRHRQTRRAARRAAQPPAAGRRAADDTFVYSITDHEWPQVKAALEASFTG